MNSNTLLLLLLLRPTVGVACAEIIHTLIIDNNKKHINSRAITGHAAEYLNKYVLYSLFCISVCKKL